jgi:phosphohistidine swiveling domain-containing protein
MALLEAIRVRLLENWHTPILGDFAVMMSVGALRRLVVASGVKDVDALMNGLLCGDSGLESVEPARRLMRMAQRAREIPSLGAALRAGAPVEALAAARRADAEFAAAFDDYIERYGDRCMGELKLETVSLRDDPSFAVQVLRSYLERPELDADALAEKDRLLRAEALARVSAGLGLWRRWRLARILERARRAVRNREAMRLCRTRAFGLERDIYRAIGMRLVAAGRLDAAEDVFYLTVDEVTAYHEGRAASANLASITRARRAEYAVYATQAMPNRFETRGPVYHGNSYDDPGLAPVDHEAAVLHGTGCYPGVVEGAVRVIASPKDELSLAGRVLVALRTDPGWTPLFPTASGILVERGSTLSHTAVVARELGIPTIVGIPGLVSVLADGERVRMDGATGIVKRIAVAS